MCKFRKTYYTNDNKHSVSVSVSNYDRTNVSIKGDVGVHKRMYNWFDHSEQPLYEIYQHLKMCGIQGNTTRQIIHELTDIIK
jgi:hypothetical protein